MRQTILKLAVYTVLLTGISTVSAEPIIGGRFIEKPASAMGTKPLFLAHFFNTERDSLKAGNYQIGLEMQGKNGKRIFTIKPQIDVPPGEIKTFRIQVSPNSDEKNGAFRIFSRIGKTVQYSDTLTCKNERLSKHQFETIPLFTEAPPEPGMVKPPPEVPFEFEVSHKNGIQIPEKVGGKVNPKTTPVSAIPIGAIAKEEKTQTPVPPPADTTPTMGGMCPRRPDGASPAGTSSKPLKADPSEFKTLRTIDEELVIYIVKKDDTIRTIAQKYYGKPDKEKSIADFNFIEHGSALKPGEEIIVDVLPLKTGKNLMDQSRENLSSPQSSPANGMKQASKKEEEKKPKKKTKKVEKVKISSSKNSNKKPTALKVHSEIDPTCEEGWEKFSFLPYDSRGKNKA